MLFDLRGRRRRAVQATYLTLAVLMGGGLVLFGIGGDVSGGLFDAFSDRSGSGSASEDLQERIDDREERLRSDPENERILKALIRDYHALASAQVPTGGGPYPEEAKDELGQAGEYWQRYLEVADEPDPSLARLAVAVYDPTALNQPEEGAAAMRIVAEADNDYQSYLALVQLSAAAGDKRTANLAADKAVELAPKGQKKEVRQQAKSLKTPPQPQPVPAPEGEAAPESQPTPEQ
jgi:hypothetical protein